MNSCRIFVAKEPRHGSGFGASLAGGFGILASGAFPLASIPAPDSYQVGPLDASEGSKCRSLRLLSESTSHTQLIAQR